MKSVRMTIEIDEEFLRFLKASVHLGQMVEHGQNAKITAAEALAIAIYNEGRGTYVEQTYLAIPTDWRSHITIHAEQRQVFEDGRLISKKEGEQ